MSNSLKHQQLVFRELVFSTLVYAVVLGFFNDYTTILDTTSYSTTFLVAIVMALLTYGTLLVKKRVARTFKGKPGAWNKTALAFSVWMVLFFSKFVFLAVIDTLFGASVQINGFIGLMGIIITMTLAKEALDYTFRKLGE